MTVTVVMTVVEVVVVLLALLVPVPVPGVKSVLPVIAVVVAAGLEGYVFVRPSP